MSGSAYTVYFELYGKKMKTVVVAASTEHAKQIVKDKVVFYKVEKKGNEQDVVDLFKNIFNIKP
jgi:hypothetical protein